MNAQQRKRFEVPDDLVPEGVTVMRRGNRPQCVPLAVRHPQYAKRNQPFRYCLVSPGGDHKYVTPEKLKTDFDLVTEEI